VSIVLKGNSPSALTAGILLLSRARSFGQRFSVEVLGDPDDITTVVGPAMVHSPVLASCGIGRELGSGALVILPGPSSEDLAVSLSPDGTGPWFWVDRAGQGCHPATQAFMRFCRAPATRDAGRALRRALTTLGVAPEPSVLDLLFGAPATPLQRLALSIRAGRALGVQPESGVTRYLGPAHDGLPDPLPSPCRPDDLRAAFDDGRLRGMVDRLGLGLQDGVQDWLDSVRPSLEEPEKAELLVALAEIGSHVTSLPAHAMLPPLDAAMDAVAVGLGPSLGAAGPASDANRALVDTFRFLGGRFTQTPVAHPYALATEPPPKDRLARWMWFCRATREAADTADRLWRQVVDPPQ
jgi:hypothetical protein